MANLVDQVPALGADATLEGAIAALAVGIRVLGNEQDVNAATKQAVRDMAGQAAQAVARHTLRLADAERVRPMTDIPVYAPEVELNDNIEEIKTPGLEIFKGTSNKQVCLSWLSRIMSTARQHTLTPAATINLMKAKCADEAFDSIEQDLREGNDLETVVISLERKFAGVCLPDEARVKCNTMKRNGEELISVYGDRLNKMARIATRHILDNDERRRQQHDLTISNVKRILPAQTKHDLEERVKVRREQAKPELTLTQFMAECDSIEQRRLERLSQYREDLKRRKHRSKFGVRAVHVDSDPAVYDHYLAAEAELEVEETPIDSQGFLVSNESDDSDSDSDESAVSELDEEEELDDDEIEVVLNAVKQANKRGMKGKKKFEKVKKAVRKIARGRTNNFPPYVPPPGPPKPLDQCKVNREELPKLANVNTDECLKCGLKTNPPHKSNDLRCPLKGHRMVDRACLKCKKGLHQANSCPVLKFSKN